MAEMENLFNEDFLLPNLKGAAYFILLYEHFEDVVISTVKDFYCDICILDGVEYSDIDDDYIKALRVKVANQEADYPIPFDMQLKQAEKRREKYKQEVFHPKESLLDEYKGGTRLKGSLIWLLENEVLSETEIRRVMQIRDRRNVIVHELFSVLSEGLTEEDAKMIAELLSFNQRINSWRFQEIEMPCMGYELPEGATPEDVMGGDDVLLSGLFRILFLDEGEKFKELLEKQATNE